MRSGDAGGKEKRRGEGGGCLADVLRQAARRRRPESEGGGEAESVRGGEGRGEEDRGGEGHEARGKALANSCPATNSSPHLSTQLNSVPPNGGTSFLVSLHHHPGCKREEEGEDDKEDRGSGTEGREERRDRQRGGDRARRRAGLCAVLWRGGEPRWRGGALDRLRDHGPAGVRKGPELREQSALAGRARGAHTAINLRRRLTRRRQLGLDPRRTAEN